MGRFVRTAAAALALLLPGLAAAQSSPSAFTSAARYDLNRRVVGTIAPDPDGTGPLHYAAVRNTYDPDGRVVLQESGELASWQSEQVAPASWPGFTVFRQVATTYDADGRKLSETTSSAGVAYTRTQWSWDAADRLVCQSVRMNAASNFASAPADACTLTPASSAEPDRIMKKLYDSAGRVATIRKAVGTSSEQDYVRYTYTGNSQQATVTDANNNVAAFTYDGLDRRSRWTFPSPTSTGQTNAADYEEYGYDEDGNRTSLRKRDGKTLTYSYDALGRMTVKVVPDGGGLAAGLTRDVYYGYDLRGLQLYARFDSATGAGVTNNYDGLGRLTDTESGGVTLAYQYDANGNRIGVTHPDSLSFTYDYDGRDRPTATWQNPGVSLVTQTYDAAGQLMTRGQVGASLAVGYDDIGRMTSLSQTYAAASPNTIGLGYSPASQIVSRSRSNDDYRFTGLINVNRAYAANGLNQYASAGTASFTYDANGNLTSDGTTTYTYDVENRLVSSSAGAALAYDPLGRLQEISSGGLATRFTYDGDQLALEYVSGAIVRRYVHGSGDDDPMYWYEGWGTTDRRALPADQQGSITAVVNSSGGLVGINGYDEYGIPNATNIGRFQYTGQAWLAELGMYYYKARVYSPTLGRFLQTDPIGYDDHLNLYAYVANDPVNGRDPTGMQTCVAREGGGQTCTVEITSNTLAGRAATGVAMAAAAVWNAGVHLYERATGRDQSQARTSTDEPNRDVPLYHRLESPTQTPQDAARQQSTGTVGGYSARGSDIPTVKAYSGPLPEGRRGVEFTTAVPPASGSVPGQPKWYPGQPGVGVIPGEKGPMAVIPATILRNTQRVREDDR